MEHKLYVAPNGKLYQDMKIMSIQWCHLIESVEPTQMFPSCYPQPEGSLIINEQRLDLR